jgi:uncharacterized membrane protein (UPF0136 family)
MPWLNAVLYAYAAILLAGGVTGYVSAQSTISLVMSAAAAVLVLVGVLASKSNQSLGYGICGAVALLLSGFFGYRLIETGKLMPGLPTLIVSLLALVCLAYGHFTSK